MEHSRFISTSPWEFQEVNYNPIFGYEDSPLLTLEEAVEKISSPENRIMDYTNIAKKKYNRHLSLLSRDESAAIYLYTMSTSFYSCLNTALRAKDRHRLKLWFPFLKLFITALRKLPSCSQTVWRGAADVVGSDFDEDCILTWSSVTSCSSYVNAVISFVSEKGSLFCINTTYGKNITAYSATPHEEEIILMPGTRLRVKNKIRQHNGLSIVHLEEW